MKNLKNYAMALVALVIAISTMTLMSFREEKKIIADDHWFEITPTGNFGSYLGTSSSLDCQETEPETPLCAVRLNDNQVDNPSSTPQPKTGIIPDMAPEKRYKNEE